MIPVLLSFGAIYAYIPVIVIVILIAAAAGLSRGTSIFAIFGIGSLMGIGATKKGQGFGGAFKTKNDLSSRTAAPKKIVGKLSKKASTGLGTLRENFLKNRADARTLKKAGKAGGVAGAGAVAGQLLQRPNLKGGANVAGSNGPNGLGVGKVAGSTPVAPGVMGAGGKGVGTNGPKKSKWATRVNANEYLISEARGMKEYHKYYAPGKSKTVIRPNSAEATTELLAFKANPNNLNQNLSGASSKKEARVYHKEQQAAWDELVRRSGKDQEARKAVSALLNEHGLAHPNRHRELYAASGESDTYNKIFDERYKKYKDVGWSPSARRKIKNEEEKDWLKRNLEDDAAGRPRRNPDLDEIYRWPNFARNIRSPEQDMHSYGSFAHQMKEKAKKVREAQPTNGKTAETTTTLTGSGWKDYYKETHNGKKKKREPWMPPPPK